MYKAKEDKARLEQRIAWMQGQLVSGGQPSTSMNDTSFVAEQQRREYASRVADLERERQLLEEDKLQVDKYKKLLLKQRDIMIALTARLNERDESVSKWKVPRIFWAQNDCSLSIYKRNLSDFA